MKRYALVLLALGCGSSEPPSDAGEDATTTDVASKDVALDVVDATDASDSSAPDAGDASVPDAQTGGNPAAATCASAIAPDASVIYTGTTCDGQDDVALSCNKAVAHKEVYVRIDGTTGQVWTVDAQGAFAIGVWDNFNETTCSATPGAAECPLPDAGADATSGIVDGPFPSARTDFVMFETPDPTPCGPYTIDVTLK